MAATTEQLSIQKLHISDVPPSIVSFEPIDLPSSNQRVLGPPHPPNTVIPLALRLTTTNTTPSLDDIVETIKIAQEKDGTFTKRLARHGTLLFRVVDRPLLAPNVAPANEAPKEVLIYNHNESPQVPHAPEYIFFYGHHAPKKGGQSPISSSLEIFNRAQLKIPEFITELAEKGILSRVTYKHEKQYEGGSTLRQAFGKDIVEGDDEETKRRKIEAQIARYGRGEHTTWEWTDDGLVLTHRLPGIRTQPGTNLPTLFTGLAAYWKRTQVDSEARKNVTQQLFGDGSVIPEKYLAHLAKITG
ncbi:hypothetical protein N7454_006372 [Penicillium verhagenii]|nr:hypothetical protein N7454_006372 [Penicillium verhagenii]